jgi:hypothetical protein
MIKLENLDPVLIDQAIRQVLAGERSPEREAAVAMHLGTSPELMEWVQMIVALPVPSSDPRVAALSRFFTAVSLGLEVGYQLGSREAERERSRWG